MKPDRPKPDDEFPPLSKRQVAELQRRVADMDDPKRFVIVSSFLPDFSLFYCPSDGMFVMNEIAIYDTLSRFGARHSVVPKRLHQRNFIGMHT